MPTDRDEPPGGCAGPSEGDGYADALVHNLVAVYDSCRGRAAEKPWPRESRAVAWARVSTEEQADKGLSIPEQLREIRAYASQRGIQIVQEFHEAASAFQHDGRRVQFHRMLAAVNSDPTVGLILVHDYSRFSRDSLKARLLIRDLREAGVRVVSLNDPPLDRETPAGVLLEAITFAKNEAYSREISFHTRKGQRANLQTRDRQTGWCYKNGGWPPWGYRPVTVQRRMKGGRPIPKRLWALDDRVESGKPVHGWVRHCLVELAGNGATPRELCEFCRSRGLKPPRKTWDTTVWMWRLLPRSLLLYSGFAVWGARRSQRHLGWPPTDWGIVEDAHPAIITPEEAVAISGVRSRLNRGHTGPVLDCRWLLAGGIMKCARCGQSLIVHEQYYVCRSRQGRSPGTPCADSPRYRAADVDRAVVDGIWNVLDALSDRDLRKDINLELRSTWDEIGLPGAEVQGKPEAASRLGPFADGALLGQSQQQDWRTHSAAAAGIPDSARHRALPPRIRAREVDHCRRATAGSLSRGSPREKKLSVRRWLDRALLDPSENRLNVIYRLPDCLCSAHGVSGWCEEHSPTLAGILRCSKEIPPARQQ